jgi:hypothetical protein
MQKKKDTRKQFTENRPTIGMGDIVEKITKATGIELATKFLMGEDCGCDARKHKLNKLFPNRQPLCMTEQEYNWWTEFKKVNNTTLSPLEANEISKMWTRIFQSRRIYKPCTCNPKAWQTMVNELTSVYETYQVQE